MTIAIDYYLTQEGVAPRIMHTKVSEADIIELLQKRFNEGELSCQIHFNREKCKVDFRIDTVTV